MNASTLNYQNSMTHTSHAGQMQLTKFLKLPEVRMFIHDLRNSIQAIVGSADTLQIALQEHAIGLAEKSLSQLKKNTNLVVDILGDFVITPRVTDEQSNQCDVTQVINDAVDSLATLLRQNGITVHLNVEPSIITTVSRTDVNRLLLNLLLNAIDATNEANAQITIAAKAISQELVQIKVIDNGVGINEAVLANIFKEGYTTKAKRGNKGLGLVIVKQVLEAYNGAVRVRSSQGKGTQFTILLPRTNKN